MAIFYMDVRIISRSNGQSAVASSAYRRSALMESIAHSAYQRGEKIIQEGDRKIHDYTRKTGVVHSQIMLPKNAPPEYADAQTLWNAVEESEKRKDAQLAREVILALPRELDVDWQIALIEDYVQENFVNKGMIADFSIHDKGDGNPHAHIMLTMRHVTPKGFGKKNTDWNKRELLMEWRKNWAEITNNMLKYLEIDQHIDHRSYKDQGVDREAQIHMGHKAWALEKKGIKTDKGDHNRAVQQRNADREVAHESSESDDDEASERKKGQQEQRQSIRELREQIKAEKEQKLEELNKHAKEVQLEKALQKAKKASWHVGKPVDSEPKDKPPFRSEPEKWAKEREATKIAEKIQERYKTAKNMQETHETYLTWDKELGRLKVEIFKDNDRLAPMLNLADKLRDTQADITKMQTNRQNLHWHERKKKKELDKEIEETQQYLQHIQEKIRLTYNIDPNDIQNIVAQKQDKIKEKTAQTQEIQEKLNALELSYHTQKLLADLRPDRDQIEELLKKISKPPTYYDEQRHQKVAHRLNTINEEDFQKVIDNLPKNQAKQLIEKREQDKSQSKSPTPPKNPPPHGHDR